MNRILAAGLAACATALAAATSAACAAGPNQTLSIDLSGPQPKIQRLAAYVADAPLHVEVRAPAAARVAIQGVSPDGSPVDVLLTGGANGSFSGEVPLGTAGGWSLTVDSIVGDAEDHTERFTITTADPPSTATASMMIALGGVSVFGGVGLLALGRRTSRSAVSSG